MQRATVRAKRVAGVGVLVSAAIGVACGTGIRRDLSAIPPGQVGFEDMCGLQAYFDALELHASPPPRVVSAVDLEGAVSGGKVVHGGRERFRFDNDFQLTQLRRVLDQNWKRLPEPVAKASAIELEVKWSEKAGTKRVLTDEDAELSVGQESWPLPSHVCLSELLYGEALYRQRRLTLGLPLPGAAKDAGFAPGSDAGIPPAPVLMARDAGADARSSDLK
jgi:hypothetical protein